MLEGIISALITPFAESGEIDLVAWHTHLQRQIQSGIKTIVINGTTGENSTLSINEVEALLNAASKYKNRLAIILNCGSNDTKKSIALLELAHRYYADAIMLINPYYNKTNSSGCLRHFSEVIKRTMLPIVLYNVPSRTNQVIPIEVIKTIKKTFPNQLALKDAGGDFEYSLTLKTLIPDLILLGGNDSQLYPFLSCGGQGLISVSANLIPQQMITLFDLFFTDFNAGLHLLWKLWPLLDALTKDINPMPIKAAMEIAQVSNGYCRLPLDKVRPEIYALLKNAWEKL